MTQLLIFTDTIPANSTTSQ